MSREQIDYPQMPAPSIAFPQSDRLSSPSLAEQLAEIGVTERKAHDALDDYIEKQKAVAPAKVADGEALIELIRQGKDVGKVSDANERKALAGAANARAKWNATAALLRRQYTAFERELRANIDEMVDLATSTANASGERQAAIAAEYMANRGGYMDDLEHLSTMLRLRHHIQWRVANDNIGFTGPYFTPSRADIWYPAESNQITSGPGGINTLESNALPGLLESDSHRHVQPEPAKPTLTMQDPFLPSAMSDRNEIELAG
jgi:hypothetical protein